MNKANIVRAACIKAYNLDYDEFLKLFGITDDDYAYVSFKLIHQDFSRWFCRLDSENAEKFMEDITDETR